MGRFRQLAAIDVLFRALLSGELPATPALPLYFYAGSESSGSRGKRFEFLKAHFDQIVSQLPNGPFPATSQLPYVGSGFCDTQSKADLKAYFEPRLEKLNGAPRILAQVLESIDQCIAVKAVQEPNVAAFLKGN
jgi:alanyl aminopeptidase